MQQLKELIYNYVSKHEAQLSSNLKSENEDIEVKFTIFGTTVACKAINEIIDLLDDNNKTKITDYLKNKTI